MQLLDEVKHVPVILPNAIRIFSAFYISLQITREANELTVNMKIVDADLFLSAADYSSCLFSPIDKRA